MESSSFKSKIDAVDEFHRVFNIAGNAIPTPSVSQDDYMLRYNLMQEENKEYLNACKDEDIVEIADALGDKLYILLGTILKHGTKCIFRETKSYNTNSKNIYQEAPNQLSVSKRVS